MSTSLLTLAVAVTIAAPVPKALDKSKLYYPTTVGDTRTTESGAGRQAREVTQTVTKVEEKDGVYTVTVDQQIAGEAGQTHLYEVSPKGVFRLSIRGEKADTPVALLKLDAKVGDAWMTEAPKAKYTMGKEEEVEVPAGKYKALRVELEIGRGAAAPVKATLWYAHGVGIVKQRINTGGVDQVTELKSFTAGKAEPKKDK